MSKSNLVICIAPYYGEAPLLMCSGTSMYWSDSSDVRSVDAFTYRLWIRRLFRFHGL